MIDPDQVSASQSDGITAPDILRVELRDVYVLDDNVAGSIGEVQAFTLDHTLRSRSNDRLIRSHDDGVQTSFVVRDRSGRGTRLVVAAPIVLVDGSLAASTSPPRSATRARSGGAGKVERLAQQYDARA